MDIQCCCSQLFTVSPVNYLNRGFLSALPLAAWLISIDLSNRKCLIQPITAMTNNPIITRTKSRPMALPIPPFPIILFQLITKKRIANTINMIMIDHVNKLSFLILFLAQDLQKRIW